MQPQRRHKSAKFSEKNKILLCHDLDIVVTSWTLTFFALSSGKLHALLQQKIKETQKPEHHLVLLQVLEYKISKIYESKADSKSPIITNGWYG